jgi:hypothetical protein
VRILKVLTVAASFAVCGAERALASPPQILTKPMIELRARRDPLRLMLTDGLVGGLTGAAVGGGLMGLMSATGQGHRDWASVLATSAGLGLAAGLAWGIIDSGSTSSNARARPPVRDGLAFVDQHKQDLSGMVMLPVLGHRF